MKFLKLTSIILTLSLANGCTINKYIYDSKNKLKEIQEIPQDTEIVIIMKDDKVYRGFYWNAEEQWLWTKNKDGYFRDYYIPDIKKIHFKYKPSTDLSLHLVMFLLILMVTISNKTSD